MIYIEKSQSYVYDYIARIISHELNLPNEITNDFSKKGLWILFATAFTGGFYKNVNGPYIVIQTENYKISNIESLKTQNYLDFLNNAIYVWDYTNNFRFGYSIINEIEYEESKPIDILFYGSLNERRKKLLSNIDNCTILNPNDRNSWFPNLWNHIRNSKIVLSINFYEPSNNDLYRIAPLLSNRVFVICEKSTTDEKYNNIEDFIITDFNKIPELCKYYLKHTEKRLVWKRKGYDYILRNPIKIPSNIESYV